MRRVAAARWPTRSDEGDPRAVTEHYFDALVDVANRGTDRLVLRRPRELRDPDGRRGQALSVCR